jgi:hypothetical protein
MKRFTLLSVSLGLSLALLFGVLALVRPTPASGAAGTVHYVAPEGDCGGASPCYASVPAAVEAAASGDEIRIAQGIYTPTVGTETTFIHITKSLTLAGGFTRTNWTQPDPETQPTVLDAATVAWETPLRSVIYVEGDHEVILEDLWLTRGDKMYGGGLDVVEATIILNNCYIHNNRAFHGAGLHAYSATLTITNSTIYSNVASYRGGGGYLESSSLALYGSTLQANGGLEQGGGLFMREGDLILERNQILSNSLIAPLGFAPSGGGLYLEDVRAVFKENRLEDNSALNDAALAAHDSDLRFDRNVVRANRAEGAVALLFRDSTVMMTNTLIAQNTNHLGIYTVFIDGSEARLLHTTFAANKGTALRIATNNAHLTNTVIVSHNVGIDINPGNTVHIDGILWHRVPVTVTAESVDVVRQWTGDPLFLAPEQGNYRLAPGSAAIDRGIAAGVAVDLEGRTRDAEPDLGAYEFLPLDQHVYLPLVQRN